MCKIALPLQARPSLEWKTRPRFSPVSLSLTMISTSIVPITGNSFKTNVRDRGMKKAVLFLRKEIYTKQPVLGLKSGPLPINDILDKDD
jgi:hypothetical protein